MWRSLASADSAKEGDAQAGRARGLDGVRYAGIEVQDVTRIQVVFDRVRQNGESAVERVQQDRRGARVLAQREIAAAPDFLCQFETLVYQ